MLHPARALRGAEENMSQDRFERRAYRKSPGRQYANEYDPLGTHKSQEESTGQYTSRTGLQLTQRPDLRRTRQLLRQSIIAGKYKGEMDAPVYTEEDMFSPRVQSRSRQILIDDEPEIQGGRSDYRQNYRSRNIEQPVENQGVRRPSRQLPPEEEVEEGWEDLNFVDPDIGYEEDPLDRRVGRGLVPSRRLSPSPIVGSGKLIGNNRHIDEREYEEDDGDLAEQEEEEPLSKKKKKKVSRRGLLVGLGVVAIGGVAAYELGPKIPQALGGLGANIEQQLQNAYNNGIAAGGNAVRKEFINSLDNLEGVSLDGAISAAKLTRTAYDVFVTPIVTLASTIAGDFLGITLRALIAGRGWLDRIQQDSDALAALQTVLETWVKKVNDMPQQLQAITDADLDGAQSYLHSLQNKIKQEQAILNGQSSGTPTASPTPKVTGTPHH
jgi:hypothetical protein